MPLNCSNLISNLKLFISKKISNLNNFGKKIKKEAKIRNININYLIMEDIPGEN